MDDVRNCEKHRAQLLYFQREVEYVAPSLSISADNLAGDFSVRRCYAYKPTVRAMLAQKGFLLQETLGSGSYSKVKKVLNFSNQYQDTHLALKIIDRQHAPQDYQEKFLPRELAIWPKLNHPHLVKLYDVFCDARYLFMVLEYAPRGDVLQHIQTRGAVTECLARRWMVQVADAVRYMHNQNIVHRDLKLENLLIDANNNMKICDFGFSREAAPQDFSSTYCGSRSYASPEILTGTPYPPKKADIWAIGVILYIMVTGKMPYDESKGSKSILREQGSLAFPWPDKVSQLCRLLILRMFTWSFQQRPDIEGILADDWFKVKSNTIDETPKTLIGKTETRVRRALDFGKRVPSPPKMSPPKVETERQRRRLERKFFKYVP